VSKIEPYAKVTYITITADQHDQRIDNYLFTLLKTVPKSHIYQLLRKGEVRVNKKRMKASTRLTEGDILRLPPMHVAEKKKAEVPYSRVKDMLKAHIIFENDYFIVLSKPPFMPVHGGSGQSFGVIEGLRAARPEVKFLELVHRLDKETSGCLLIAKSRKALLELQDLLRHRQIKKTYITLVLGSWPKKLKKVALALQKNTLASGERIVRVDVEGKPASTDFTILQQFMHATLLKAQPLTGRTHQIRVHAAASGYPIVGDKKYADFTNQHTKKLLNPPRLFLHAAQLQFHSELCDKDFVFEAPLPDDLRDFLEVCDKNTTTQ
jgi:23S rRNA pseudouridine955/2504/2580 synthase